ncbi:MFS transporter [Microaerobacter geothermalis]|nr:MFS transporter [Microaerobacter geothermalis]
MDKRIGIIMTILMTVFIGFGLIIPVMPEMVAVAGAAPFHLGMLLAIYSAMSFFFSPLWGGLSDKIGRRPIILVGLIGFTFSFFLFGIAADKLWLMYVSRILGGLFSGAVTSCAIAYIADITSIENRTKGMGLAGMSIGLGFIFGPAVGGMLSRFGNETPFFASSILALIIFVFAYINLKESLSDETRREKAEQKTSRWKAFAGSLKYLYLLSFVVSFTLASLEGTLQYYEAQKIGATPFEVGIMFAISGIVGAGIQGGVVRKRVKQGDESKAIFIGLIVSAIGFTLIIFSRSFWTATLFIAIFGAGNALIRPCVTSLISQKTTFGQGVATGLISSMDSLGRIGGPILGTLLYQYQMESPFVFGAVVSLLSIGFLYRFLLKDRLHISESTN